MKSGEDNLLFEIDPRCLALLHTLAINFNSLFGLHISSQPPSHPQVHSLGEAELLGP